VKNKLLNGTKVTLVLSIVIILLGYFMTTFIYKIMPSYKNSVKEVENVATSKQLFDMSDEAQVNVYPWNLYNEELVVGLSENERYEMSNFQGVVNLVVRFMKMSNIDLDNFKREVVNNLKWLEENEKGVDGANDKSLLLLNNDIINTKDSKTYNIKFSIDGEDYISFISKEKRSDNVEEAYEIKAAYQILDDYVTTMDSKLQDYFRALHYIAEDEALYKLSEAIESVLSAADSDEEKIEYDIFSTDSELLLVYSLKNRITLILYFDPISQEFIGFNLQQR